MELSKNNDVLVRFRGGLDFVYTHKIELPKYSRLVSKAEIVDKHDFNLNIRRYVDNTPDPEPQNVQAHLLGGVPEVEVQAMTSDFAKFGIYTNTLFQPICDRPAYLSFSGAITSKSEIKTTLEANAAVQATVNQHRDILEAWWQVARNDFAALREGKKMPEVRQQLLGSLKTSLIPLGVLDEFKSAGVFVNWWQQIRYDLKTVIATGWHHTLIPDSYLISAFFQAEAETIANLEVKISEAQSVLAEAVEAAQEIAAYEPDEDETVTAAVIKKVLKDLIDDLKDSKGQSASQERETLQAHENAITALEKIIKDNKARQKVLSDELALKLQLKRIGSRDFKAETLLLLQDTTLRIAALNATTKNGKKLLTALQKDETALKARLTKTDAVLKSIGGQLTEAEAKTLILKKLHDIATQELNRYINTEKRQLIQMVENLWDKYAISTRALEAERSKTILALDVFLTGLGYFK